MQTYKQFRRDLAARRVAGTEQIMKAGSGRGQKGWKETESEKEG